MDQNVFLQRIIARYDSTPENKKNVYTQRIPGLLWQIGQETKVFVECRRFSCSMYSKCRKQQYILVLIFSRIPYIFFMNNEITGRTDEVGTKIWGYQLMSHELRPLNFGPNLDRPSIIDHIHMWTHIRILKGDPVLFLPNRGILISKSPIGKSIILDIQGGL